MTLKQLDLLLQYINLKAMMARKEAKGEGVSPRDYDRLPEIIGELEELCEDAE